MTEQGDLVASLQQHKDAWNFSWLVQKNALFTPGLVSLDILASEALSTGSGLKTLAGPTKTTLEGILKIAASPAKASSADFSYYAKAASKMQ